MAVEGAGVHGVTEIARRLGLNHSELKRRCGEVSSSPVEGFWEIPSGGLPFVAQESVVEVEDASGSRVRLVLRGTSTAEVVAAAKELWSVSR